MKQSTAVLTVEEAAEVLRVGPAAVYAGIRNGSIPSIKVGRYIRVPHDALCRRMQGIGSEAGQDTDCLIRQVRLEQLRSHLAELDAQRTEVQRQIKAIEAEDRTFEVKNRRAT